MEDKDHSVIRADSPLVSVIVPVYNVLPVLDQCIESLSGQSYQHLEILLVDDGSTDGSGEQCDWWAAQDKRICVLHKENAGAASARNAGLDSVRGHYIGFLDSDDWVTDDYFQNLVDHLETNYADLAISASSYVYDDIVVSRYKNVGVLNLTSEDAFKYINVPGYFGVAVWDKLARADLFDGLRFPDIDSEEDYAVAYALLDRAERIIYDSTPRHFYRQSSESLSNKKSIVRVAKVDATRDMVELVRERYPAALQYAIYGHIIASLGAYNSVLRSGKRGEWSELKHHIEKLVRSERRSISAVVSLSRARRVQLWMVAYAPWLYRPALVVYKTVHPRRAE